MNPTDLSKAIRRLVNRQSAPVEPDLVTALAATNGLDLPAEWLAALLAGWTRERQAIGRRGGAVSNRAAFAAFALRSPVRFLSPAMLPAIDLRMPDEPRRTHGGRACICRLCGHTPAGRGQSWCPDCWQAFGRQTAIGWDELARVVYERAAGICECGCQVDVGKAKKSMQQERQAAGRAGRAAWRARWQWALGRRVLYDIDHLVPLVDGGEHELANLRLLYTPCHLRITGESATRRARVRNGTERQACLFQEI